MHQSPTRRPLPLLIKLWFAADLALALLPPVHWAAGSGGSILGVPGVLVYFLGASIFVSASVIAAYLSEADVHSAAGR